MRKIGVVLPDQVFERVEERASRMQIDVSSYLATAISELVLKSNGHEGQTEERTRFGTGTLREMPRIGVAQVGAQGRTFDIESAFRRFPKRSTSFAQRFVDEAAKIANVGFRRNRRGIAFEPNFAWIEYLLSRGGKGGIKVSLYGRPEVFHGAPACLKTGRGTSYSRALIETEEDLEKMLPMLRQAYELRFGPNSK